MMTHVHSYLSRAAAQEDETHAKAYELAQARTERDLALMRVTVLESLLKQYGNKIIDLQMQIAVMEAERKAP